MAAVTLANGETAELLAEAVLFATDKIPDTWFEKIPYYQTEEAKLKRKQKALEDRANGKSIIPHRLASVKDKLRGGGRASDDRPRRRDDRRHRSFDEHGHDSDSEHSEDERRDNVHRSRGTTEHRHREYDQDGSGSYTEARAIRNHFTDGHSSDRPHDRGDATPPVKNGERSMNGNGYHDIDRPASSGPVPGYVPYAAIYHSPSQQGHSQNKGTHQPHRQSPYDGAHDNRDRRGSDRHKDDRREHRRSDVRSRKDNGGRGHRSEDEYSSNDSSDDSRDNGRRRDTHSRRTRGGSQERTKSHRHSDRRSGRKQSL